MKTTLSIAALAAVLAAPVYAGALSDPIVEQPIMAAPAPVLQFSDWTGGYVGAQLGYAGLDLSAEDDNNEQTLFEGFDSDGDGGLYGVHAGYMYDLGTWVLGAEIDYDVADIEITDDEFATAFGDPDASVTLDSIARLKLRAGYDAGRTLIYGTAGAAKANVTVFDGVGGEEEFSDTGYFAGLGVAYMVSDQFILGGEVLSHQFDDFDNSGIDADVTTATLRASFKF